MRRVLLASALFVAPHLAAASSLPPGGIPFSISFTATFLGDGCEGPSGAPDPFADYVCAGAGVFDMGEGPVEVVNPAGAYRGLFDGVTGGLVSTGRITGQAVGTEPRRFEAGTTCILFDDIACPSDYPAGHAFLDLTGGAVRVALGANTETRFLLTGATGTAAYVEDLAFASYEARFALSDVVVEGLPTVPLPASVSLLALGLAGLAAVARRR